MGLDAVTADRRDLGSRGEELAKRHLLSRGYRVLESNYRAKGGEIDLVAEKDGTLVFVEVRTRHRSGFGSPEESVTARKRAHLVEAAQEYLQASGAEDRDWRIDLVAVRMAREGRVVGIDLLENAVEL